MTSEKRLREIAAQFIRDCREGLSFEVVTEHPDDLDDFHPDSYELCRVSELVESWPILDIPVPDSRGYLFPKSGINYGNVHTGIIRHPEKGAIRCIRISRGLHPITLTHEEALELASLLTAAAMEEA